MSAASFLLLALLMPAQAPPPAPPPAPNPSELVAEVGASRHELRSEGDNRMGPWQVVHASLHWQPPRRVRPLVDVERQSRLSRSHARVSGGVYVDWTSRLYSYQAISLAPSVAEEARFYPKRRIDGRVFWKPAESGGVTLAGGYTVLTFTPGQRSQIVNVGALLYRAGAIAQATIYLNRNDPGGLYSSAGNLSVQFGAEGRRWYGVSISRGRELYRLGTLGTTATADFTSATAGVFARQWLTTTAGIHLTGEYQRVLGSYSRLGVAGRFFVGF